MSIRTHTIRVHGGRVWCDGCEPRPADPGCTDRANATWAAHSFWPGCRLSRLKWEGGDTYSTLVSTPEPKPCTHAAGTSVPKLPAVQL